MNISGIVFSVKVKKEQWPLSLAQRRQPLPVDDV
jgi:hypothetical protein